MDPAPSLEPLFRALRSAGLRLGFAELARLQQIFRHPPALAAGARPTEERLASLLRAVVVKSRDDEAVFDGSIDGKRTRQRFPTRNTSRPGVSPRDLV